METNENRKGYKKTKLGLIPDNWEIKKIRDFGKLTSGSTPLRSKEVEYFHNGSIPWVKTMDLNNGIIKSTDEKITEIALKESSCPLLDKNTVLVAMYGGFNQIGRTGLLAISATLNQAITAINVEENEIIPIFLLYWLNGRVKYWKRFAASSRKDPNITKKDVGFFPVTVPPLPEQKKIAEIFSTWDLAIEKTENLIEAKTKLKKGLMQQLLTGKVRFKEFVKKEGFKDTKIGRIPEDWKLMRIKELGKIESGGTPDTTNPKFWNGDINWITPTEITALKNKYIIETKRTLTSKGLKMSSAKILPINTVIVCTRATIGELGINKIPITTNQGFKNIIPNNNHISEYIYYKLILSKKGLIRRASGSTFLEISKKDFSDIQLDFPLLKEQKQIAITLSNTDKEIEKLQDQKEFLNEQKKGLMQQLLTGKTRVKIEET